MGYLQDKLEDIIDSFKPLPHIDTQKLHNQLKANKATSDAAKTLSDEKEQSNQRAALDP